MALFAEHGVGGTTVAQVARAAGVTPAMVYYYFRNREGLLDALVEESLAPRVQYIWEGVAEAAPMEPRQIVTNIVTRLLEVVEECPELPQLWSREIFHANGCLRGRLMRHVPWDKFETLRKSLGEAQQRGALHPQVSPDLVVISAISLIMLPLAAQKYFPGPPGFPVLDKVRLGRHSLALMLDGLCPGKENLP